MSDLVIILNKQIEELQAALEAVVTDDIRWMREVLQDYCIRYDDHSVGRRIALTTFIYGLKEQIAALNLRAESLDRVVGECGQRELVLEARVKELTEVMEKIVELSGKDNSFVQTGRLDDIHKIAKRR
jgi:hypothetical protein